MPCHQHATSQCFHVCVIFDFSSLVLLCTRPLVGWCYVLFEGGAAFSLSFFVLVLSSSSSFWMVLLSPLVVLLFPFPLVWWCCLSSSCFGVEWSCFSLFLCCLPKKAEREGASAVLGLAGGCFGSFHAVQALDLPGPASSLFFLGLGLSDLPLVWASCYFGALRATLGPCRGDIFPPFLFGVERFCPSLMLRGAAWHLPPVGCDALFFFPFCLVVVT